NRLRRRPEVFSASQPFLVRLPVAISGKTVGHRQNAPLAGAATVESCIDASRQSRAAAVTQRLAGRLQPSSTHMATYVPSRPQGRFLRYQFDSAAQLRRHCQLVEGRVLLFFPEARPVLGEHTRALIELCVA